LIWFADVIIWLFSSASIFLSDWLCTLLINDVIDVQAAAVFDALTAVSASCSLLTRVLSSDGVRLKLRTSAIRLLISSAGEGGGGGGGELGS